MNNTFYIQGLRDWYYWRYLSAMFVEDQRGNRYPALVFEARWQEHLRESIKKAMKEGRALY